jgi:hypothetical protein
MVPELRSTSRILPAYPFHMAAYLLAIAPVGQVFTHENRPPQVSQMSG